MVLKIIDYGAGNLASIKNGFKKSGVDAELISNPGGLENASGIILPGVGSFGDAMEKINEFKPALDSAIKNGIPFLGICLGLQVLFEKSSESPGSMGLGFFKGECVRFNEGLKVPHMGWNNLELTGVNPLFEGINEGDKFYFVHSYYVSPKDDKIIAAKTDYGVKFASACAKDNIYALQFHPEKSSLKGLEILKNFEKICKC